MGKIVALSISKTRGVPKVNVQEVDLRTDWGIDGDAHAGEWHRQVSLLMLESINRMRTEGADVHPGDFAENITTERIDLLMLSIGDRLEINDVVLEITQIGKECHNQCTIYEWVGDCVMPREGLFAKVLRGGKVKVGDDIRTIISND